jgi:predicted  nucleic acid-binding Zn-ribbon protein
MIEALQHLSKLQSLEFGEARSKAAEKQAAELRSLVPLPILAHYDRFRVRGKKGLVAVRNQVCTGCHMSVPIGKITVIMRGDDIQLCENCGRYLYLPEPVEPGPVEQVTAAKPAEKPKRRRKALVAAG